MEDDVKVLKINFVSGNSVLAYYSKNEFQDLMSKLEHWDRLYAVGPTLGINFALVTHYEIINDKVTKVNRIEKKKNMLMRMREFVVG